MDDPLGLQHPLYSEQPKSLVPWNCYSDEY